MSRFPIRLDTVKDVQDFVNIAQGVNGYVHLEDGEGMTVNGKSLMGCLYSLEFRHLYCTSEEELAGKMSKFIR